MPPKTYADIPPAAVCDYLLSQGWTELPPAPPALAAHSAYRDFRPPDPRQLGIAIPREVAPADDRRTDRWAMTLCMLARALHLGPNGLAMTVMDDSALWQLPRVVPHSAVALAAHPGFVWEWGMLPLVPGGTLGLTREYAPAWRLNADSPNPPRQSVPDLDDATTVALLLGHFRALAGEPFAWVEPRVYCGPNYKILTGWQVHAPQAQFPRSGDVGLSEGDAVALAVLEQLDRRTRHWDDKMAPWNDADTEETDE